MAKHVFRSPIITLSSVDLTDHVESAELVVGVGNVDVTAITDSWEQSVPNQLKRFSVRLGLYQDYAAASVYATVYAVLAGSTAVAFTLRPTTSTQSATNPTFSGTVVLDGDWSLAGGTHHEAHKTAVSLKGAGDMSFYTSATA